MHTRSQRAATALQTEAMSPQATFSPASTSADRLKAIGLMVAAVTLFSVLDATSKHLSSRAGIPISELVWMRFLIQFVLILAVADLLGTPDRRHLVKTKNLGLQLVRSMLMLATTALNFLALKYLRLDQTVTIIFLTPLLVALLAGPLLGEWVGGRRFIAIVVGFGGILVAVRPGFATVNPAIIFSLLSVLAYALFLLLTRYLAPHENPLPTLFYSMMAGAVLATPLALAEWVWPSTAQDWFLLCSLGALGGTGHYFVILAHRLAPAAVIAPFLYAQLIGMTAAGYVVFADIPDVWSITGAAIVIASGLYLLHRERVRRVVPAPVAGST